MEQQLYKIQHEKLLIFALRKASKASHEPDEEDRSASKERQFVQAGTGHAKTVDEEEKRVSGDISYENEQHSSEQVSRQSPELDIGKNGFKSPFANLDLLEFFSGFIQHAREQ